MRTLSSAPTLAPAGRAEAGPVAASRAVASVPSEGGARPGLAVLRAPADAPIQRVEFSRFQGIRRLWNWSYNDHETRMLARERQARESVESLNDFAAHPVYGARVAALRQRLATHQAATVDTGGYAGHQAALDTLHEDSERLSYGISAHLHQLQQAANARADALHQETLQAHADIQTNGMSPARLNALDDIQRRHTALMTHVHQHNLDLPVPDRDALTAGEHNQIQSDWRALSRTNNVIDVHNRTPEIEANLRSMHARLLAGTNGRRLMRDLVSTTGAEPLTIARTDPDPADAAERAQRVVRLADIGQRQVALDQLAQRRDPEYMQEFRALGPNPSMEDRDRIAAAREAELGAPATALAQERRANETPSPAAASPTGARVTLREGIRDSELLNQGAMGPAGRPDILAPAHIIYGHELLHVMRRRRAVRPGDGGVPQGWTNPEERATIEGVGAGQVGPVHALRNLNENALRDDYGLTHRELHSSRSREAAGF